MTEHFFDHDRLDVYRLSVEYVANAFDSSRSLDGLHRHARDQWLRAAQSIPLNIAEGNGKRSLKDRARFLGIARSSALECAAIQDVLVVSGGLIREADCELKSKLVRIVEMLTRMEMKFDGVSESPSDYNTSSDYEHPVFGRLEKSHDIPAINMHWWTGVILFPLTKTDVIIELHGTPIGPSEIQQHSFTQLLSGCRTLIESATSYDFESLALHNWELKKIVIFANGHMDLRLKSTTKSTVFMQMKTLCF